MSIKTPISILVVDDVPLIRDTVKIILADEHYAKVIGEAGDGKEAIEVADNINPDIVLMDINMPIMNGIEAAKIIRQRNKNTKIVMLTSCTNDVVIFTSFAAGADGYILKDKFPATIETAITTVRLGSVWLDPAIAHRILEIARSTSHVEKSLEEVLTAEEVETLNVVSHCTGSLCLVDPGFIAKLRSLAPVG